MGKGVKKSKNGETADKADKGLAYFDELNFPRSFKKKEKCHNFKFNTLRPKKVRCCDDVQQPLRISGELALYNLLKSKHFRHEPYIHCKCSYNIGDYRDPGVVSDVCPKPALVPLRFCKKMKKYNEKEDKEPELNIDFPMRLRRDRACERLMRQIPRCPYLPKEYANTVKFRVPQFACIPKPIYDTLKCRVSVGVCISDPSICTLIDRSNIDFCGKNCKIIQSKEKIQRQKHEEKKEIAAKNNFVDKLKRLIPFWKSKNKDKTHKDEVPQKLKAFPAKKEPEEDKLGKNDGPEKITFLDVMEATCKEPEQKFCEIMVDIKADSDKDKGGKNANEKYKPAKKGFLEKVKSIIPFWGSRKDKAVRKVSSQSFKVFSDKKTSLKETGKPEEEEIEIEESVSFLEIMAATCREPDRNQAKEVEVADKILFIDILEATCHEPERDKYPFGKLTKKAKVDFEKRKKSLPKCEETPPKRETTPPQREKSPPRKEEIPPKREKIPPKKEEIPPKKEEIPTKKEEIPPKKEKISPKKEKIPPKKEEIPPKKEEIPPKKEENPPKSPKPEKLESKPKVKGKKSKSDNAAKSKKSKGKRRAVKSRKLTDSEDEALKEFLSQIPSSDLLVPKKKNLKKKNIKKKK